MDNKTIIGVIIITILIVVGGIFLVSKSTSTPQIALSASAKAEVSETSSDWGKIPMNNGNVTKEFTIKNSGNDVLKLFNVKTSCHCTKALIVTSNSQSPQFGMDSLSSWVGEVAPGEKATLKVIFDPAYHGVAGVGPINRFVSLETNDRENSKLTFTVVGVVFK